MSAHWLVCGTFPRQRAPDGRPGIYSHSSTAHGCRGLKIDLETEEAILEPQHLVDVDEVCPTLTP